MRPDGQGRTSKGTGASGQTPVSEPAPTARRTPGGEAGAAGNAASTTEVGAMFDRLAPRYDLLNAVISLLQEPRWRRRLVDLTELQPGMTALDVATGTGKVAEGLADRVGTFGRVLGIDISRVMIERARRAYADRVEMTFIEGDALALPVEDGTVDAATIAFGMRNLPDYERGFAEMRRAVRPGGRIVCLEAARPRGFLGGMAWLWFERLVPLLGRLSGEPDAYRYLVSSVRSYPGPQRIAEIMRSAGLEDVRWFGLTAGMVTIHTARRPAGERP